MSKNGWTKTRTEEIIKNIELGIENRLNLFTKCSILYRVYDDHDEFILVFYKRLIRMKYLLEVLKNEIH